ncbi:MAG: hypothetical protein V4530_12390 [Pseudomonadota bacterium]
MHNELDRRRFLARSTLLGTSVTLFPMILGGCGGSSEASAQSSTSDGAAPVPVAPAPVPAPAVGTRTEWRTLKVGAGGFVTGIDIAPDGTKVVRADSAGAFVWNDAAASWKPLLTMASMPAGEVGHEISDLTGVYEVAVAPSNSNVIYMIFNGYVFKSTNRGVKFIKTSLIQITAAPNDNFRTSGRKIAIDPVNPDVVYVGSQTTGLFVTQDGGVTWARRTDVPASTTAAGVLVAFDPKSPVVGGKTRGIYASSAGNGVYASVDGGASFAVIPGSPTAHAHMVCSKDGAVFLTDSSLPTNNVRRYASGAWTLLPMASDQSWHSLAVNPANSRHIVAGSASGALAQSFDGGDSWGLKTDFNYPTGAGGRAAADIPWLAWTNEDWLSAGALCFDPSQTNKLYFAEGVGVWWTNPPSTLATYTWQSQSLGIEQLVSSAFVVPPGGAPVYFAWDRPVFKLDDLTKYPSTHGPNRKYSILCGWSGGYAVDDPRFIVGLMNWWGREESGYSTDGGATWTKFATVPADLALGKIAGSIAVSTKDNIVWLPSNNGSPYYTKDRGITWTKITLPNVPTTGDTGWGWAYYLYRHAVAADKVTPGTFYLYNYLAQCVGLYRSTNGGDSWTRVYSSEIAPASTYNASMTTVPGKAGHLFFTSGEQSGPNPAGSPLMRSTDGGASWSAVANTLEVYCVGYGKAAAGSDYPAIYIAGYVSREWGIWRSDDNTATWKKIGDYPLDTPDLIKTISGDMDVYGRVYVGFGGTGAAYAELVSS